MKRITYLLAGMILGGLVVATSLKYHVLRTNDGFTLVPKLSNSFESAYVDVREFGLTDWAKHQALTAAIIQSKKEHILQSSAQQSAQRQMNEWISGAPH